MKRPKHYNEDNVLVMLNDDWRVVSAHNQWIVQEVQRNKKGEVTGWRNRSFCGTRYGLEVNLQRRKLEISPERRAVIDRLPDVHPHDVPYREKDRRRS